MNPFTMWTDVMKAQAAWARLGMGWAETLDASGKVIGKRMPMIAEAMTNPAHTHGPELARMMPEKIDAFTWAGFPWLSAWTKSAVSAQRLMTSYWRAQADFARTAGKSLAPVKRRATGNARRLAHR